MAFGLRQATHGGGHPTPARHGTQVTPGRKKQGGLWAGQPEVSPTEAVAAAPPTTTATTIAAKDWGATLPTWLWPSLPEAERLCHRERSRVAREGTV